MTKRRVSFIQDDEGEIEHELHCYNENDGIALAAMKPTPSSSSSSAPKRSSSMSSMDGQQTDTACCGLVDWWLESAEPGYMWILYQRAMNETGISSISNWQRREFSWQESAEEFSMMYASENEHGKVKLACILAGENGDATVALMMPVALENVTEEMRSECRRGLLQYETARGETAFDGREDLFEKQVPEKLYPVFIRWFDRDGKPKQKILASAKGSRHVHKVVSKINRVISRRSQKSQTSCVSGLLRCFRLRV